MIDWVQRVAQKCAVVNEIKKKKKRGPVLLLTFGWLRSHQCTRSRSLKFVIQLLNRVSVLLNTISIIHNLFILNPIICQEHWHSFCHTETSFSHTSDLLKKPRYHVIHMSFKYMHFLRASVSNVQLEKGNQRRCRREEGFGNISYGNTLVQRLVQLF